jgi:hypothetical protein
MLVLIIEGISSLLFLVKKFRHSRLRGVPGFLTSKPPPLPLYRTLSKKGLGLSRFSKRFALKNRMHTHTADALRHRYVEQDNRGNVKARHGTEGKNRPNSFSVLKAAGKRPVAIRQY